MKQALVFYRLNHLLGNVIIQLLVGIPLEVAHKIWRIGPIYLLAVTSGSLLQYAIDPNSLLVGASAGVYALIFAHVANVILVSPIFKEIIKLNLYIYRIGMKCHYDGSESWCSSCSSFWISVEPFIVDSIQMTVILCHILPILLEQSLDYSLDM